MTERETDLLQNKARMAAGELYFAFTPDLVDDRRRCSIACENFNRASHVPRRALTLLVKDILRDPSPLPEPGATAEEDEEVLADEPWIDGPVRMDYGYNVRAAHPLDPVLRNGTRGPEYGKPIKIGPDCWFGGNCIVLPGVNIGRGVTVGAGSVVTKDIPDFVAVAGNPARIVREVPRSGEFTAS
ncbi:galactoside O-acetyltransferase [Colletotrichum sp. SAR 10_65]|nr:galactoside O-acetyltransferase [Colletotrichum sp. SAR 10_75]KAI8185858.1 galactoside O-acetyltransferase [Colletotrichum sp. SAR 10_65]